MESRRVESVIAYHRGDMRLVTGTRYMALVRCVLCLGIAAVVISASPSSARADSSFRTCGIIAATTGGSALPLSVAAKLAGAPLSVLAAAPALAAVTAGYCAAQVAEPRFSAIFTTSAAAGLGTLLVTGMLSGSRPEHDAFRATPTVWITSTVAAITAGGLAYSLAGADNRRGFMTMASSIGVMAGGVLFAGSSLRLLPECPACDRRGVAYRARRDGFLLMGISSLAGTTVALAGARLMQPSVSIDQYGVTVVSVGGAF